MMVELDILKVKYRVRTKTAELKRILRKARKEKNPPNGNVSTTKKKKRKRKVTVLKISVNPPNGNVSKVVGTIVAKKRPRVEDIDITMIHDFQITASSYVQV